eukprot:292597_1
MHACVGSIMSTLNKVLLEHHWHHRFKNGSTRLNAMILITNYWKHTITITINDCSNKHCVELVEDEFMEKTHTILTDDFDQTVQIKKTEITGNAIVSVVTISMKKYVKLDTDPIAERIENEINDDGFDVEVEIKETGDDSDNESQDEDPMQFLFLDEQGIIIAFVIATFVIAALCGLVVCLYKRKHDVVIVEERFAENSKPMDEVTVDEVNRGRSDSEELYVNQDESDTEKTKGKTKTPDDTQA